MFRAIKRLLRKISPAWLVDFYHFTQAAIAALLNGFPAKRLKVIGVTGTDGKTTTCHLIDTILSANNARVGRITTIDWKIGEQVFENNYKMTTPSPFLIQRLLRKMVEAGCEWAVVEVTSIGLSQHRLLGIPFYGAVFTNLTHDHLDYHGSMEAYRLAKEKLFRGRPFLSVINADDPASTHFLKHPANRTLTYALKSQADLVAKKLYQRSSGIDFVLLYKGRQATINLPLLGEFNVYNSLAAAATALGLNYSLPAVVGGLRLAKPVPGRMEVVDEGQAFSVIIDYAHTPDALQKVYETLRPSVRGRLIAVLGATGERDKTKRPIMGAIAGRLADFVIVTNEDPYREDPEAIINQVAEGVARGRPKKGRYKLNRESDVMLKYKDTGEGVWWWRILDRREAIAKALEMARPQDTVVVTGKGAEKVMAVADKLVPYSDRAVLEELLQKYRV